MACLGALQDNLTNSDSSSDSNPNKRKREKGHYSHKPPILVPMQTVSGLAVCPPNPGSMTDFECMEMDISRPPTPVGRDERKLVRLRPPGMRTKTKTRTKSSSRLRYEKPWTN